MKRVRLKIAISSLLFLSLFLLPNMGAVARPQEHQEEFQQTYSLSQGGAFELRNVNGLIVVTTWPEEKVEIKAVKRTRRDPKNLQLVRIEVSVSADRIAVDTVYPRLRNTGVSVDYDVRVPERLADVQLRTVNGRIQITGPLMRVKASAVNGDVRGSGVEGLADFSTTNGRIEAAISTGPARMETVNGSVECRLLGLKENLSIETVNGSVELRLTPEVKLNAYLEARTTNGSISVEVPLVFQNLRKTRGSLEGQIGNGGPLIRLRTVNGGIRLAQ